GPMGTAEEAAIEGFLVAGKTGTAQKADERGLGYAKNRWVASFVGFVPADEPRLVIAVVVDEPVVAYYGGVVAGPIFRRIAEASLRHLGVLATDGGRRGGRASRPHRRRAGRGGGHGARGPRRERGTRAFRARAHRARGDAPPLGGGARRALRGLGPGEGAAPGGRHHRAEGRHRASDP